MMHSIPSSFLRLCRAPGGKPQTPQPRRDAQQPNPLIALMTGLSALVVRTGISGVPSYDYTKATSRNDFDNSSSPNMGVSEN